MIRTRRKVGHVPTIVMQGMVMASKASRPDTIRCRLLDWKADIFHSSKPRTCMRDWTNVSMADSLFSVEASMRKLSRRWVDGASSVVMTNGLGEQVGV